MTTQASEGSIRFPAVRRLGLGVGLDVPWGPGGFVHDVQHGDAVSPSVKRFLAGEGREATHLFFAWQPRDRSRPRLADYRQAWDDLWSAAPSAAVRALHHTALNLGAVDGYQRGALFEFTNALVDRYQLEWINEDLGLWSVGGKPLPYPLPPYLTTGGLRSAIAAIRECQAALTVPLVVEFPGFSQGVSLPIGPWHAFDYFRLLAEESESPVTLDVGHLLSWQWLRGRRGNALYDELERLPLAHCFEIHLSGCEIIRDRFIDAHHGVLLDEQLELLARLVPACPNLRAITYEDPKLDDDGRLIASNRTSFDRLRAFVHSWANEPPTLGTPPGSPIAIATADDPDPDVTLIDAALVDLLYRRDARVALAAGDHERFGTAAPLLATLDREELEDAAAALRDLVLRRTHRGTGGLQAWYAQTIAAWQSTRAGSEVSMLVEAFLESSAAIRWRDSGDDRGGISLEEAFFLFADDAGLADASTRKHEFISAIVRALVVCPEPAFAVPDAVRRCPGGWFAIAGSGHAPVLHAALGPRYVSGPITPLLASVLAGEPRGAPDVVERARVELSAMGLVGA